MRAARISLIPTAAALPASGLARVLARSCAPARVHEGERCGSRGCAGRVQRHGAAGGDEKGTGGRARRGAGGECGHWRPARRFNSSARSRARLPQEGSTARCGAGSQRARGTCSGAGCAVEGHSSDSIWNSWEVWRACSSSALREGRCSERTEKKLRKGMCWGADPWERRRLEIIIEGASLVYSTVTA